MSDITMLMTIQWGTKGYALTVNYGLFIKSVMAIITK